MSDHKVVKVSSQYLYENKPILQAPQSILLAFTYVKASRK